MTTIVGRDYSTIDLTALCVANRLNVRGFEATKRRENPSGTNPDATKQRFQSSLFPVAAQLVYDEKSGDAIHNSSTSSLR